MGKGFIVASLVFSSMGAAAAQRLSIVSCSSSAVVSGHDCTKAYDGNTSSDWEGRASGSPTIDLDLGKVCGIKRVVITWGANIPSGFQINGKNNAIDTYQDIIGVDAVSGPVSTVLLLPWSQEGFARDTARYVQIEGYGNVTAMDIKEVAIYGRGLYTQDEILIATYPIGNVGPNDGTRIVNLPQSISEATANRLIGLNAFVYGDDGSVQNLSRFTGYPLKPGTTLGPENFTNLGGTVDLLPNGAGWMIQVSFGQYFQSTNYSRKDINRGYVNLYYLSHDPDYLERE